jgi:hypothetical protein
MSTKKLPEDSKLLLRRISHALKLPMNMVLPAIIEAYAQTIDSTKVCAACKDKASPVRFKDQALCDLCPFNTRAFNQERIELLQPITYYFQKEISHMKPNQVSVLISKKIGKNFCSWSVSHGVTAELEAEDHFKESIAILDSELKSMVALSLPSDFKAPKVTNEFPNRLPAMSALPALPEFTTG